MTIEVVLLALATTIRPTSLAAIYALVAGEAPRRLMIAYVVSGLAFTVGFGLLVIWAFHGVVDDTGGDDPVRGIAQVGAGVIALVFALLVQTRVIGRSQPDDAPTAPGHLDRLRSRGLSIRAAALAGPATHIPGLFYLLALNVVITHRPSIAVGFIEVVIYNLIWFLLPFAALVTCIVRPPLARDVVSAVEAWARANARPIVVIGSLVVGVLLLVRGLLSI